ARQARSQPAAGRSLANVEADLLVDYLHQAIDQADQTGRTSTGKPVGQASRVKPVGQASQAEPAGQASQVQPDRKAVGFRLGEPARPVSPGSKPAAPVKPAGSPQPGERVGPVAPVGPPQVIGPAAQAGQAPPVDPVDQAQLAETVASADAAGPAGPVTTIARQIRPGGVRRATARNARLLVMVEADALDATKTVAGPRQAPGSENLGRSIATSTSRLLVKMGPARLDPAHSPGAGHRAPPKGADPPKLRGESQTVDMRLPVDASPPDGVLAGLMVGTGSVVTGPDLDGLVALANRQAMVVDPATGRLVALGARPSRPSSNLVIPEVTWAWDDPSTWPAERAWSDGRLPSGWLALMLMVRDQTCRWPGCTVPATDCQFDHLEPFSLFRDAGAQTWAGNLVCVCLMHHRLRHDQGWAGRRDPTTGQTFWSGPHGQTLARPPERFD
ncbi:MAG: hypothetical protein FWD29_04900, partial [Micrococcales bacterium]|nr:hypothetical protein [Micrococcales bacterium]